MLLRSVSLSLANLALESNDRPMFRFTGLNVARYMTCGICTRRFCSEGGELLFLKGQPGSSKADWPETCAGSADSRDRKGRDRSVAVSTRAHALPSGLPTVCPQVCPRKTSLFPRILQVCPFSSILDVFGRSAGKCRRVSPKPARLARKSQPRFTAPLDAIGCDEVFVRDYGRVLLHECQEQAKTSGAEKSRTVVAGRWVTPSAIMHE